jgi:octaprenyl-diphosphate synthase
MLHNATLVHDDVVDEADERRGIKSINALWNNKIAVLVGDYYLAQGLLTAIDNDEFEYLKILSNSVKRMSEGELLSLEKSKDVMITEEIYFEICSNKTASLLSSCCEIGAVSANADAETRAKLASFGEKIGVAFQLKDDLFDYTSSNTIIGKPTGNDIKEKKITLPLIFALSNADDIKKKEILKIIKKKKLTKKEIQYVVDFAIENGGINYTQRIAEQYIQDAKDLIAEFDESSAKSALIALTDFIINRKK